MVAFGKISLTCALTSVLVFCTGATSDFLGSFGDLAEAFNSLFVFCLLIVFLKSLSAFAREISFSRSKDCCARELILSALKLLFDTAGS